LAHKHWQTGNVITTKKELEDNYVLPKNPFLKNIVESFVSTYGCLALPEVVVSDVANGMVGTIDRLEVTGKRVHIGDYKTNNDFDTKKQSKYQKQLSFYAQILKNKGYEVDGLSIFYLDGEAKWNKVDLEVLEINNS
jgi:ATP-dependent exoDNAse (exonuclease V) beta subunit